MSNKKFYSILFTSGLIALLIGISWANHDYDNSPRAFPKSGATIYNYKSYRCVSGVLYSTKRSLTPMIDRDSKPVKCTTVTMTNEEFSEL